MVAAAGIVCQGQPKAGLALQQKHRNVSWTHFKALVKRTTFVNNNFKNAASYLESSLQPMKVPGREQLQNGLGYEPPAPTPHSRQPYASWLQKKRRRRDETNELAKSCNVLHVVSCREPAGLDQTPEAGRNTKGNITKPFESIIFGGYQKSCKANEFKKGSKRQLIETQKTRSHSPPLPFSENSANPEGRHPLDPPRWKLRKECHQLRVANTQCQGLVVAAANLSMPSMLSYINSTLDSLSHVWPRSLAKH